MALVSFILEQSFIEFWLIKLEFSSYILLMESVISLVDSSDYFLPEGFFVSARTRSNLRRSSSSLSRLRQNSGWIITWSDRAHKGFAVFIDKVYITVEVYAIEYLSGA